MTRFLYVFVAFMALAGASAHAGWKQTFADEFNGDVLDKTKWNTTYAWGDRTLAGNGELECYMDENVTVSGGQLLFKAEKRDFVCPKINKTYHYASGAVTTLDHFSQTYGYFEMRVKMPKGQGFWPAFWLLPASLGWPPEIDIFESYMGNVSSTTNTFHWTDNGHKMDYAAFPLSDQSANYHVFGLDWQKGLMIFYIDGKETRRITNSFVPSEPMYILANLAIQGGSDAPTAGVAFPQNMQIDYIHAFARVNDGTSDALPPSSSASTTPNSPSAPAPAPVTPAPSAPAPTPPKPSAPPTPSVPSAPAPSAPAAPSAGTSTLSISAASGRVKVGGSLVIKGRAGTKFVNVAVFDVSNGYAKVSADVTPAKDGSFVVKIDASKMKRGAHTLAVMAFTKAAGQSGGDVKSASFALSVSKR